MLSLSDVTAKVTPKLKILALKGKTEGKGFLKNKIFSPFFFLSLFLLRLRKNTFRIPERFIEEFNKMNNLLGNVSKAGFLLFIYLLGRKSSFSYLSDIAIRRFDLTST